MVPAPPIVLQVLPSLGSGGVERGTIEIAAAIAAAGATSLVASAGGRLVPEIARAGGRHVCLPLATKNPLGIWRNAHRLTGLIGAERVGIVHARSRAPAWSALLAARRTGVHFVTTYHGAYGEDLPFKRRYNAVMAMGERVIVASRFIAELVAARHGVGADRLRLIPRGIDPALFDPDALSPARTLRLADQWRLPPGAKVVVRPGRLTRRKGQALLIEALARLARGDVIAVLVGADQGRHRYAEALRLQAERLGVSARLRFAGDCADMPAALALADLVVSASLAPEAFGRVVIEAQAMARPVIASAHGGAAETIRDGQTGWLIPPGDAAALARAIEAALSLPAEQRLAIGERARAAVRADYTTAAMQRATLEVYRELAL